MAVTVRNPQTGQQSEVVAHDDDRKIIKLKNGTTVIDTQRRWQYYHPTSKQWFQCFKE